MLISEFKRNRDIFQSLLHGLTAEEYLFREANDKWNLLEVLCHLYDEEREDFKIRLKLVLFSPGETFPSIDPVGWVKSRNYAGKDFETTLGDFIQERNRSMQWLSSLENPQMDKFYTHPVVGPMSGHFILANWLAHDYLHIRQITRIKYNYLKNTSGQNLDYAGNL